MTGYAPATVETVSVPLPGVTVRRPLKRGDGYRLELGRFVARGSTLAAARADLARQLGITAESVNSEPGFARADDNGDLLVVLDRPWGLDSHLITDAGHRLIGTSNRDRTTAEEAAANRGFTAIPPRR
ncbi:hypothetical protein C6N75_15275 [Streptomyces solincola]|uniref:Uncharacterized protein n=1 Tax=Streptomyces solincola TaxID=2100817 RepID=A0A2S9PVI5_9ACTN|nr:hypothetical protein [Streptomyces solincola]PRH78373.1 hypothetical protein C6N75_15275 [Streptomyces solincola]